MEPLAIAAALKALGKVFSVGQAAYKVSQSWGLKSDEIAAVESLVNGSADLAGMLKAGGSPVSPRMFALHTALVMRAFGAACARHWAGDATMAPGLDKPSWVRRPFLSKKEEDRRRDIDTRLRRALDKLAPVDRGAPGQTFGFLSSMLDAPLSSLCYQALWEAFTNPLLEEEEQARLLELDDAGARLEFERWYLLAYAEALASPAGTDLAREMVGGAAARPALLRGLLVRGLSTWKRQHVFGEVETPGVPNMPLGDIYVEPDGIYGERRKPIRQLVRALLGDHKIVVVRGDFGHGKSLTARTLACEWAEAYLTDRTTSSPDLVFPVFIKCGVDFTNHEPALAKVVPRALFHQARALRIELAIDDPALASPPGTDRVVYLVDGLDEVALTFTEVKDLFKDLDERTGDRHRAVVFSRKGAIPEGDSLRGIPIVDVQPLRTEGERSGGQVAEWLENWNRLSGKPPITMEQLKARGLLEIVTTPILLFMAALTWNAEHQAGVPLVKADIYEQFFRQIAAGKCKQDQDQHQPVIEASRRLLESLVQLREIPPQAPGDDEPTSRALAMLWLMARIAWEGQRCLQQGRDLSVHDVTTILRGELGIQNDPKTEELVRIGVLLVLQADHHGGNDRILFGHKSFREFLVARYWASQLRRIVAAPPKQRANVEKKLLGPRLLGDGTFDFLVQILDGAEWDRERGKLVDWASDCFNDEAPRFGDPDAKAWRTDRQPIFREAALAIGSSVKGSEGLSAVEPFTLRTMLGWFWMADDRAILVAPQFSSEGANLAGTNLEGANLAGANLLGANLLGANLVGASLQGANLQGANLFSANLQGANLFGANLLGANLFGANLLGANLLGANLLGANLHGASLRGASLQGANLQGANLERANLTAAEYDAATVWPTGYDPPVRSSTE